MATPSLTSSPYDPPLTATADIDIPPLVDPLTHHARRGMKLALPSLLGIPLAVLILALDMQGPVWSALYLLALAASFAGGLWGIGTTFAFVFRRSPRPPGLATAIASVFLNGFGFLSSAYSVLLVADRFVRGRQLRDRHGQLLFAELVEDSTWLPPKTSAPSTPRDPKTAIAWRENGLTEHASVVAFARLAEDLTELGAPMSLIENAHKDALDEMRHTRLCFGLACQLDGRALGPGAFPKAARALPHQGSRAQRLAQLATEALVDGALNEGVSARVVAELARTAEGPARRVLLEVARDEARHAAHAMHVLRWCVEAGGQEVIHALEIELEDLPTKPAAPTHGAYEDEAFGIPSQTRIERVYVEVRARLNTRVTRLMRSALQTGGTSSRGRHNSSRRAERTEPSVRQVGASM